MMGEEMGMRIRLCLMLDRCSVGVAGTGVQLLLLFVFALIPRWVPMGFLSLSLCFV